MPALRVPVAESLNGSEGTAYRCPWVELALRVGAMDAPIRRGLGRAHRRPGGRKPK